MSINVNHFTIQKMCKRAFQQMHRKFLKLIEKRLSYKRLKQPFDGITYSYSQSVSQYSKQKRSATLKTIVGKIYLSFDFFFQWYHRTVIRKTTVWVVTNWVRSCLSILSIFDSPPWTVDNENPNRRRIYGEGVKIRVVMTLTLWGPIQILTLSSYCQLRNLLQLPTIGMTSNSKHFIS